MLFNQLCKIIEMANNNGSFANLKELLSEVNIFFLTFKDQKPSYILEQENLDLFILPFSSVAFNYAAEDTIFDNEVFMIIKDAEHGQIGSNAEREVYFFSKFDNNFFNFDQNMYSLVHFVVDKIEVCDKNEATMGVKLEVKDHFYISEKGYFLSQDKLDFDYVAQTEHDDFLLSYYKNICMHVVKCMDALLAFNADKKSFILEEKPVLSNKQKNRQVKKKKIPRSCERPLYTFLSPDQIRGRLGLQRPGNGNGNGSKKVPHERRAHLRRLLVDSGFKENKIVPVKSSWIGQSEKQIGNKLYKVIL